MIPRRLVRTVPEITSDEVEGWWQTAAALHPGWEYATWRDPIDPTNFPRTAAAWKDCSHPAQMAGLIRLEDIWQWGGIYLDSDVEVYRSFEPLRQCRAFAAWEDHRCIPDAVFGAEPHHPAVDLMLELALERLGKGPWYSGPGVFTEVLPGRADVVVFPPGAFYPYLYTEKHRRSENHKAKQPWAFCAHHWFGSWVPEDKR